MELNETALSRDFPSRHWSQVLAGPTLAPPLHISSCLPFPWLLQGSHLAGLVEELVAKVLQDKGHVELDRELVELHGLKLQPVLPGIVHKPRLEEP